MLSNEDLTGLLTAAGGAFGALVVSAYPLMRLVRVLTQTSKDNARDASEKTLYDQLSNQVNSLSESLAKSREESSELLKEIGTLRNRVVSLEGYQADAARLKIKLDQKDAEILEAQNRVYVLNRELDKTKQALSKYETVQMKAHKPKPDPPITII